MVDQQELIQKLECSHPYESIRGIDRVHLVRKPRFFTTEEEEIISERWAEFKAARPQATAEPIVGYHKKGIEVVGTNLVVPIYKTDYAAYKGLLNTEKPVWTAGASGIVELHSDEGIHIPFGYRNSQTLDVGGTLETLPQGFMKHIHLEARNPYEANILDELEEETGITEVDGLRILHKGHIYADDKNTYCNGNVTFVLEVPLTPEEAQARYDVLERKEHDRIDIVLQEKLVSYVDENFGSLAVRTRHTLEDYLARLV